MSDLDDDLIINPLHTSNIKVNKEFVVDGDVPIAGGIQPEISTVNNGPLGDNIPGQLPDFDAKFKIINENKTKILSFKDIEQQLINGRSIGQETARYIEQECGNFLKNSEGYRNIGLEGFLLGSFTKEPSSINFNKTLSYMHSRISMEETDIITNTTDVICGYVESTLKEIDTFNEDGLYKLIRSVKSIANNNINKLSELMEAKDFVIMIDKDSYNLARIDLTTSNMSEVLAAVNTNSMLYNDEAVDLVNRLFSMSQLIQKRSLSALLLYLKNHKSDTEFYDLVNNNPALFFSAEERVITYIDLVNIFVSEEIDLPSMIEHLYKDIYATPGADTTVFRWNPLVLRAAIRIFKEDDNAKKINWIDENIDTFKNSVEYLHTLDMLRPLLAGLTLEISEILKED